MVDYWQPCVYVLLQDFTDLLCIEVIKKLSSSGAASTSNTVATTIVGRLHELIPATSSHIQNRVVAFS